MPILIQGGLQSHRRNGRDWRARRLEHAGFQGRKAYVAAFDPGFVGATGTPDALAVVRKSYGVTARKQATSGGDYVMDHSSSIYLIDRTGKLRAL